MGKLEIEGSQNYTGCVDLCGVHKQTPLNHNCCFQNDSRDLRTGITPQRCPELENLRRESGSVTGADANQIKKRHGHRGGMGGTEQSAWLLWQFKLSTKHNVESPENTVSMRDCLDLISLPGCLWGILSIGLISGTTPKQEILKSKSITSCSAAVCGYDKMPQLRLPTTSLWQTITWSHEPQDIFPTLKLVFVGIFCQNNRKETKTVAKSWRLIIQDILHKESWVLSNPFWDNR